MKDFHEFINEAAKPSPTVSYRRWSATNTQHTMNYTRRMRSSVPNAMWYEVNGSYDKKKKDYHLIRDGVVIAHVAYRPSQAVWRFETIYGVPRGGIGMGRSDKGKYALKKSLALSSAEKEILEGETTA